MVSSLAQAHDSRPLYIELTETEKTVLEVQWKTPSSVPAFFVPTVNLPGTCQARSRVAEFHVADGLIRRARFACLGGLAGGVVGVHYPGPNPSLPTLIRYIPRAGEEHTVVLGPQNTTWVVPNREAASSIARDYIWLGVRHIWSGVDHLLFVACLLWVAGTWRRILLTTTGFTIAHSITLIASALQSVRLPTAPVEVTIALSIVFLAWEITRGRSDTLTWQHPLVVSTSFGLLHGFGFATALREVGLPKTELITGLVTFNIGVEIGQIVFAGAIFGLMRIVKNRCAQIRSDVTRVGLTSVSMRALVGYSVGTLSTFWLLQRCLGLWPQSP